MPVTSGAGTLKDAVSEAMRDWVRTVDRTHYIIGSVVGPHPFPWMVREFQRVIGEECLAQLGNELPDVVVACVGGGSNSMGIFYPFAETGVELVGVEAGGHGLESGRHGASITAGRPGVLHGTRTYLLQDADGQVQEAHSISAGLDYPGVGPEHAYFADSGLAIYETATDEEALAAVDLLARTRGDHPRPRVGPCSGLGHPQRRPPGRQNGSGQSERTGRQGSPHHRQPPFGRMKGHERIRAALAAVEGAAFLPFMTAGLPTPAVSADLFVAMADAGADAFEVGIPYSDPLMDGPVIMQASQMALAAGTSIRVAFEIIEQVASRTGKPVLAMTYANPVMQVGWQAFVDRLENAGACRSDRPRPAPRGIRTAAGGSLPLGALASSNSCRPPPTTIASMPSSRPIRPSSTGWRKWA